MKTDNGLDYRKEKEDRDKAFKEFMKWSSAQDAMRDYYKELSETLSKAEADRARSEQIKGLETALLIAARHCAEAERKMMEAHSTLEKLYSR